MQAEKTAKHVATLPLHKIMSSPLLRTKQTADAIALATKLVVEVVPLLRERVNWGDDPHQSYEAFEKMWRHASEDRTWMPPIGDSSQAAGKRVESVIEHIHEAGGVALVTHGGVICDFLRNVFTIEEMEMVRPGFSKEYEFGVLECSITHVVLKKGDKPKLMKIADVGHL